MRDLPILMNGPMVRATLADLKTQTRRVMKPQPFVEKRFGHELLAIESENMVGEFSKDVFGAVAAKLLPCPYGQPGDRLWVRETFGHTKGNGIRTIYKADCTVDDSGERQGIWVRPPGEDERFVHGRPHWTPSIHMPRSKSRITLEVTGVRVERLNEISREDAQAEGIPQTAGEAAPLGLMAPWMAGHEWDNRTSVENFAHLWESINGPGSWAANPWVWVVEFKRCS